MLNLEEVFKKHANETGEFDRIKNPPSKKMDLCAFILLDKMLGGGDCIIIGAMRHRVLLWVDIDEFAAIATEEQVVYLIRCGVLYSARTRELRMET